MGLGSQSGCRVDLLPTSVSPPTSDLCVSPPQRPMGSLGLLASDYAAGSDEEEEAPHDAPRAPKSQSEEKEDKLTDWKKMACLLCRRQIGRASCRERVSSPV